VLAVFSAWMPGPVVIKILGKMSSKFNKLSNLGATGDCRDAEPLHVLRTLSEYGCRLMLALIPSRSFLRSWYSADTAADSTRDGASLPHRILLA
jgi:hypothetical protein